MRFRERLARINIAFTVSAKGQAFLITTPGNAGKDAVVGSGGGRALAAHEWKYTTNSVSAPENALPFAQGVWE